MKIKAKEYNRLVKLVRKLKSKVIDLELSRVTTTNTLLMLQLSRATTATTLLMLRKQLQEVQNHDAINQ